ncbi:MAG TPA: zinc ABC transporter substrate-binding protein [Gallionella sp.]|nr:zinc ABC transporter substrate-binding protein [Gallionella sp.]
MKKIFYAALLLLLGNNAHATLNIFACEPEWAALAQQLAGPQASIYTATTALQDPHHIEARPSLIAKARRADLVVCTGAELEIAWLPVVQRESGNDAIAPGKPGYFEAAQFVHLLEVPTQLDRAEGDVHPGGNPHIQLDPRNFLPVAKALAARLAQLDPAQAAGYQQRQAAFATQWRAAIARWEKQAAPLRGLPIVVQHRAFPYLNAWLGLKEITALEPKPGMEPSAAHLAQVQAQLQQQPARMVVRAAYQNPTPSEWISARAHIPMVVLPFSVGGSDRAKDLFGLFDDTIAQLLAGLQ